MMTSNNNKFATSVIFYLCATSAAAIMVTTSDAPSTVNISNDGANRLNGNANSSNSNNNVNGHNSNNVIALLPWKDNNNNGEPVKKQDNQQQQKQSPVIMANSKEDLHLDEHHFVATTPKIHTTKIPNRYEQGLEDYEEAVARVDKMKEEQKQKQIYSGIVTIGSLFNTVNTVWNKVSAESKLAKNRRNITVGELNFTGDHHVDEIASTNSTDVAEGRYIQGDPLKGYYDFIITEGSYKFWAAFQLFTAGLMIYSTFAAIYYSKVNPVVGDYDYTSYLGGARSLADDPEPLISTSPLKALENSYLFTTAAHGFQFVLDAIEKAPQT